MLVELVAADAGNDEDGSRYRVGAVRVPELEQLLAPQLLVDFPGETVSLVDHRLGPCALP